MGSRARQPASGGRGRGRGKKRAREPSPPPLSPPPQLDTDGQQDDGSSGSGRSDSEAPSSDSDREGAVAALAAVHAQPMMPAAAALPQLSVRQQALQLLQGFGVQEDRANQALDDAAEDAEEEFTDAVAWAEDAQIKIATRVDFEDFRDDLALAMDVSLREEQQRKQAELPLLEWPDERVQQEFADSSLLQHLLRCASPASVLSSAMREPLLKFLDLERRCKKWYSIACHYFQRAAEDLTAMLGGEAGGAGGHIGEPAGAAAGAAAAEAGAAGAAAAASTAAAAGAEAATGAAVLPPLEEDLAEVLAAGLCELRERVEKAVFCMPAGGDPAAVPQLFTDAIPEGYVEDCIVLSDDEGGEEGGQMAGSAGAPQQQQQQQAQQQQEQQRQQQPAAQLEQQEQQQAGGQPEGEQQAVLAERQAAG